MKIEAIDFSVSEPSLSSSPIKRNQDDNSVSHVEGSSSKWALLEEDVKFEALTPFFWTPAIFPSWVSNNLEEFVVVVANKNLAFVWSLYVTNKLVLFADASRTLFRVGSLFSKVDTSKGDVLGSGDFSSE